MSALRKIKKLIHMFDNKFTGGVLNKGWKLIKKAYHESRYYRGNFFHGMEMVVINESVSDMLMMQYSQKENKFLEYQCYDYAVRYLAILEYKGLRSGGFALYRKMDEKVGNYGEQNDDGMEQHSIKQFKCLLDSVEKNGFDNRNPVKADRNLMSKDGSHRNTVAFYYGVEMIQTEVYRDIYERRYSLDWFWKNGFKTDEILLIKETMEEMLRIAKERIGDYYAVLYPPAEQFFDSILSDIREIDPDNCIVTDVKDYRLPFDKMKRFLFTVYRFDDINLEHFERKMEYLFLAAGLMSPTDIVKIRIISMNIDKPRYHVKQKNGKPESLAMVRLKGDIRSRYRDKADNLHKQFISGYTHDVIIHTTDNYISNHGFEKTLETIDEYQSR